MLLERKNKHGGYCCPNDKKDENGDPMCTANDFRITKMGEVVLMNRTGIDQPSRRKNRMAYEERWDMSLKGDPVGWKDVYMS